MTTLQILAMLSGWGLALVVYVHYSHKLSEQLIEAYNNGFDAGFQAEGRKYSPWDERSIDARSLQDYMERDDQ